MDSEVNKVCYYPEVNALYPHSFGFAIAPQAQFSLSTSPKKKGL